VTNQERQRAIDLALVQMEKQFGKGSVLRLGSTNVLPVTVIPSGSLALDAALGVGGFPRGRVVEVYGPESSGKTTIALQVIAQAHQQGGTAARCRTRAGSRLRPPPGSGRRQPAHLPARLR